MHPSDLRKPLDVVDGKDRVAFDETVNEQRVSRRIDLWNAGMMPLEMQIRGRDRAHEILERRERATGDGSSRRALRFNDRSSGTHRCGGCTEQPDRISHESISADKAIYEHLGRFTEAGHLSHAGVGALPAPPPPYV